MEKQTPELRNSQGLVPPAAPGDGTRPLNHSTFQRQGGDSCYLEKRSGRNEATLRSASRAQNAGPRSGGGDGRCHHVPQGTQGPNPEDTAAEAQMTPPPGRKRTCSLSGGVWGRRAARVLRHSRCWGVLREGQPFRANDPQIRPDSKNMRDLKTIKLV